MLNLDLYQIDSFSEQLFKGNPAAVMPLPYWLPEATLQAIAMENNLSETAFMVPEGAGFRLRWFTPNSEVDLCGHATLATAWVLFQRLGYSEDIVRFFTRSGELQVSQQGDFLAMDFPCHRAIEEVVPDGVVEALGAVPIAAGLSKYWILRYENEAAVRALRPDFDRLLKATERCVIVTAQGDQCDFVSRFFAPRLGVNEDPVTGSAHCTLAPYWSEQLNKKELVAQQVSARGGQIFCQLIDDRVVLKGQCRCYLVGSVSLPAGEGHYKAGTA